MKLETLTKIKFILIVLSIGLLANLISTKVSAISTNNTGWFFTEGSWGNPSATYDNITHSWRVVDGSNFHYGSDYYAQDWNWGAGASDNGKSVVAPIGGKVIWAGEVSGYGKSVVIQWDTDGNYAWRAAHLSSINKNILDRIEKGEVVNVLTGDNIGKVGNTGSNDYHLHSSFYKNIKKLDGEKKAIAKLKKGEALGSTTTGGADKFAYSQCEKFSNAKVVLFNFTQCLGDKKKLSPGFYNLSEHGFDEKTKSIYLPKDWSVKVYRDANRSGSSRCLTGSMWNLQKDSYTDGTLIALKDTTNGVGTITSIEVFNGTNCIAPLVDGMTFDSHVSHPNGSQIGSNFNFTKIWRLKNTGTTTWTKKYKVAYVSGNKMNGPDYVNLTRDVAPNETIDISIALTAPKKLGLKTGYWALQNAKGAQIGNKFEISLNVQPLTLCDSFTHHNVVLFGYSRCIEPLTNHGGGFTNLSASNNLTKSIYIPSGKSVRVYDLYDKKGSTVCLTGVITHLSSFRYEDNKEIVDDLGFATISSLEVFDNVNCTPTNLDLCPSYSSIGIVLFSESGCRGESRFLNEPEVINLTDSLFNDVVSSIYVPANTYKSIMVYEHTNKTGANRCVDGSMHNLTVDYYEHGNTSLNMNDTISSIEFFTNEYCVPHDCFRAESEFVTYTNYNCSGGGTSYGSGIGVFFNLEIRAYANNLIKSLFIEKGYSARIYEGNNGTGASRCINKPMLDLRQDFYTEGGTSQRIVTLNGTGTISSFEIFNNTNCSADLPLNCHNYNFSNAVIPFADYKCNGNTQYSYPNAGWWNLDLLDNNIRSIYIPSGKSVKLYEEKDKLGRYVCVTVTTFHLRSVYFSGGGSGYYAPVDPDGNSTISSMEIFNDTNCGEGLRNTETESKSSSSNNIINIGSKAVSVNRKFLR